LFLFALALTAQIAPPRVGYVVDRHGALRPVTGVSGAFMVGEPIDHDVLSAAFSGKTLVVKKDRELFVDSRRFEAPQGPVEIKFDKHGKVSEVFFRDVSLLWTWNGQEYSESNAAHPGETTAVIREDEVLIKGIPVRLPSQPRHISQMGEDWLVIYADGHVFAIRDLQVFELPESEE
jgi:hypothetical protein